MLEDRPPKFVSFSLFDFCQQRRIILLVKLSFEVVDVLLDELVSDGLVIHLLDVATETFTKHLVSLPLPETLTFVYLEHLLNLVQLSCSQP